MSTISRPRQRRRNVLTCIECRKRKQKCDRGFPCIQCVARGTESLCKYEVSKFPNSSALSSDTSQQSSSEREDKSQRENHNSDSPALLRHAQDYGYSDSDTLSSMGMLSKVIKGIDAEISAPHPAVASQMQNRIRSEYYGYIRRLPSRPHCEFLFQTFFARGNDLNVSLNGVIFGEQFERWCDLGYDILFKHGPERLPEDLQCFPALVFQVLALSLQYLPSSDEGKVEELKFAPIQTFAQLSTEYSECGVALSKLAGKGRSTLVGVQQSLLRDIFLINKGDLMQGWIHSGQSVKAAMAIGLHLEPEMPSFNRPEELLDSLWMNEVRKRTWLNLFAWDNFMGLNLGQPMFIDLKQCTITAPIDCEIPKDRLKRVPVPRTEFEKPTPMTERLLRLQMTKRCHEIRELEVQGPIPRDPEKVKELHHFAINFRKSLPPFFRAVDPDKQWDEECPFIPIHRELLLYLIDSFLVSLHRPYIFTRESSQNQVYQSALAVLDSQDRFYEVVRASEVKFYIGVTFPTFDAAVLICIVLVSNPERYRASFPRAHRSLQAALERLTIIGSTMQLARTGADILETIIRRVVEAQERVNLIKQNPNSPGDLSQQDVYRNLKSTTTSTPDVNDPTRTTPFASNSLKSNSMSPDSDQWQFEVKPSAMDWTAHDPSFAEFDFSNLEVPMPLKELFLDEDMAPYQSDDFEGYGYDPSLWMEMGTGMGVGMGMQNMAQGQNQSQQGFSYPASGQSPMSNPDPNGGENMLWSYLTGYSSITDVQPPQ